MRNRPSHDPVANFLLHGPMGQQTRPYLPLPILALGCFSFGMGLILLCATILALCGRDWNPVTDEYDIPFPFGQPRFKLQYDPDTNTEAPKKTTWMLVVLPTVRFWTLGMLGGVLGAIGLQMCRKRRSKSWLCLGGLILCSSVCGLTLLVLFASLISYV
jgi:hypothetical protein